MALLDIHEIETRLPCRPGVGHEIADHPRQLRVAQHGRIVLDPRSAIQQRMAIGDAGARPEILLRTGIAAGVRDLEPHQQVIRGSVPLSMSLPQRPEQLRVRGTIVRMVVELIRTVPGIPADGHGLSPPDQLGARPTEVHPPSPHEIGRLAVHGLLHLLRRVCLQRAAGAA